MAEDKKQLLTGRLMGSNGLTVRDLGSVDEATKRQVQRDLKRLRESQIPLETTEGQESVPRYKITNLPWPGASLISRRRWPWHCSPSYQGTTNWANWRGEVGRSSTTPSKTGTNVAAKQDLPVLLSAQAGWNLPTQLLRVLSEGLINSRRLRLNYRGLSDPEPRWRLVDPWQLFFQDHWYLRGWDPATATAKTFRTERILDSQLTDERFKLPDSQRGSDPHFHRWDIADQPPNAIECRVDESLARWLKEIPSIPASASMEHCCGWKFGNDESHPLSNCWATRRLVAGIANVCWSWRKTLTRCNQGVGIPSVKSEVGALERPGLD